MNGLTEQLLVRHYVDNYGGAVRRLNAIRARLATLDWARTPVFEINGLKREELIAASSVVLHEIYFESLGGVGDNPPDALAEPPAELARALERDFGSVKAWREEFTGIAKALAGGSGWVILAWSERLGRLVNQWAADHAHGLAGAVPILALDMYEHAYHMDYGANAKAYVDTFMRNIDWNALYTRYEDAAKVDGLRPLEQPEFGDVPSVGVEEVKAMLDAGKPVQVVDARPRASVYRTPEVMHGATWRNPERLQEWVGELSKSDPVVVFCAYGFHVGCKTAIKLRELGFDAKYMTGGHSAWKAIGGPMKPYSPA
jgi:Fe-Mn family superoxide dismutase